MKLKTLAVAAALVATGAANATIQSSIQGQGSELILTMWNQTAAVSSMFDLGITIDQFTASTFGAGTYVQWNFLTGDVTSNVAFADAVTGDWSAAWNQYLPSQGASQWGVYSADYVGGQATYTAQQTSVEILAPGQQMNNTEMTSAVNLANGPIGNMNALIGNHATVANGGGVANSSDQAYNGGLNGFQNNFHTKSFVALTDNATSQHFIQMNGTSGRGTVETVVTLFGEKFTLDVAAGTLTYGTVTAVPEPGTYGLMLAGLLGVGFVARRRAR